MASINLDGIVLAGGAGRRIGGGKAQFELSGRTLTERAIEMLTGLCRHVVVAGRAGVPLPQNLGCPVVCDVPNTAGPVAGISVGLAALTADDVLVIACDLPLAGPALHCLARLPIGSAAIAVGSAAPQPLCARLPRIPALAIAQQMLATSTPAAMAFVEALHADRILVPDGWLANVNTIGDAAVLEGALAGISTVTGRSDSRERL
jgi:molybdopterin-guanine dinucleotide biosynthesis protein A